MFNLKGTRVWVSLLFFVLISFLFLDFSNVFAPYFSSAVLYPQFAPSLLHFLHDISLAATGFVLILLVTLAVGRVYCSTICPLGTLQDLTIRAARKKKGGGTHTENRIRL